jgi:hypothetical protein
MDEKKLNNESKDNIKEVEKKENKEISKNDTDLKMKKKKKKFHLIRKK